MLKKPFQWSCMLILIGWFTHVGLAQADNPVIYIPNYDNHTIGVITPTLMTTIEVGLNPLGGAVKPDSPEFYITNYGGDTVNVLNTLSHTVVATIPVGTHPRGVAFNPNGTRVYVSNETDNNVSVIDTITPTVIMTIPVGIAPSGVAVSADGKRAYVANYQSHDVSVLDTVNNLNIMTLTVGISPSDVALNPTGTRLYVTNSGSNEVSVIDTLSYTVMATLPVGIQPQGIAINPTGTEAYVTNYGEADVTVLDIISNTVVTTIAVGTHPRGVDFLPDGTQAYILNYGNNTVSVLNTMSREVITTLHGFNGPAALGLFIRPPFRQIKYQTFLPITLKPNLTPVPTLTLSVDFNMIPANKIITMTPDIPVGKQMGATWARAYLPWFQIEKSAGQYDWQFYDETFAHLHENGFKIMPVIYGAPEWAAVKSCGPMTDVVGYENFVHAAILRYGDMVDAWEFTNEPDAKKPYIWGPIIGCWGYHPQEFAEQMGILHRQVKQFDPTALVVAGGIAYDNWDIFERSFFSQTLQAGAGQFFDVANFHYYPINPVEFPTMAHKTAEIKAMLKQYGLENKLLWVTETGMWVNLNGSVEKQRNFIVRELTRGYGAGLSNIFWFDPVEHDTAQNGVHRWLISRDHQPINGYNTFQNFAQKMTGTANQGRVSAWPSPIEGYKFTAPDRTLFVVWSNSTTETITFTNTSTFTMTDRDGLNSQLLLPQAGQITVEVGNIPIFLERNPITTTNNIAKH